MEMYISHCICTLIYKIDAEIIKRNRKDFKNDMRKKGSNDNRGRIMSGSYPYASGNTTKIADQRSWVN